jgi:bifunctional non-homologous end joining protein LigD
MPRSRRLSRHSDTTRKAAAAEPLELPKAVSAPLPPKLAPQLATLSRQLPSSGPWIYEIKFDGYRLLARIANGTARLFTRHGNDWTAKLEPLARAVETLKLESAWLDGEIAMLDEAGNPNFNALQNAFDESKPAAIVYFLFDVPFLNGLDLRRVPLVARRARLKLLLEPNKDSRIRYSSDFEGDAAQLLQAACKAKLEGLIAKRADAPYDSGKRTETWLKLKCTQRQEFVIGGFTDRVGAPNEVGGLVLGVYDADGKLRHVGNVGTGWDSRTGRALRARLSKLQIDTSSFADPVKPGRWSRRPPGEEHWVKPELVAEVTFSEWTADGKIRHPSFIRLREGQTGG